MSNINNNVSINVYVSANEIQCVMRNDLSITNMQ